MFNYSDTIDTVEKETLGIEGIFILKPRVFDDERGFFFESFNAQVLNELGVSRAVVQDNHVRSKKGVLRGLHFQYSPMAQAKFLRVLRGSIFDVAVDLREGSPTFGKAVSFILSEQERNILFIPEGFAHGYLSLEDDTEVLYKVTNYYAPASEGGIRWDDPDLSIEWPQLNTDYIVSDKDKCLPTFKDWVDQFGGLEGAQS